MGNTRNIVFWVVLFLLVVALFNMFNSSQTSLNSHEESFSTFMERVERGEVQSVMLDGEKIYVKGSDGGEYYTIQPEGAGITDELLEAHVVIKAKPQEQSGLLSVIGVWLPFLLLIGVWIFFMNRMQGGGRGGAMGFGKSKAKLLTEKAARVTFDDVAGLMRPRKNWKRLSSSCVTRRNSPALAV